MRAMKSLMLMIAVGLPMICSAQTGGGYDVSHSNAHGSGRSSGGQFTVDGTIGQAAAGTEHFRQVAVGRVVVILDVAGEAHNIEQHVVQMRQLRLDIR